IAHILPAERVDRLAKPGGLLGDGLEGSLVGRLGVRRRKILGRERTRCESEEQGEEETSSVHTSQLFLRDHGEPSTILARAGRCKLLPEILAWSPLTDTVWGERPWTHSFKQGEPSMKRILFLAAAAAAVAVPMRATAANPIVAMETSLGTIKIELDEE